VQVVTEGLVALGSRKPKFPNLSQKESALKFLALYLRGGAGHPLALARAFGRPIALTSANKSGDADATNAQEAFQTLENSISLFLDVFQGLETSAGKPSTVIQCLENETKVLREGAVSIAEINSLL